MKIKKSIVDLSHDEVITIKTPSCTSGVRSKIVVENMAGQEMFCLSFLNDGSEYSLLVDGKNKLYLKK